MIKEIRSMCWCMWYVCWVCMCVCMCVSVCVCVCCMWCVVCVLCVVCACVWSGVLRVLCVEVERSASRVTLRGKVRFDAYLQCLSSFKGMVDKFVVI